MRTQFACVAHSSLPSASQTTDVRTDVCMYSFVRMSVLLISWCPHRKSELMISSEHYTTTTAQSIFAARQASTQCREMGNINLIYALRPSIKHDGTCASAIHTAFQKLREGTVPLPKTELGVHSRQAKMCMHLKERNVHV